MKMSLEREQARLLIKRLEADVKVLQSVRSESWSEADIKVLQTILDGLREVYAKSNETKKPKSATGGERNEHGK